MQEDNPYTILTRDELDQLLATTQIDENTSARGALALYIDELPKPEQVWKMFDEVLAVSIQHGQELGINQAGQISDVLLGHNLVVHKLFKGALLVGCSLASLILRTAHGVPPGPKEGLEDGSHLIEGCREIYHSIERISNDPDKLAIFEAIESISFRNSYITLRAPGPTLSEITDHLKNAGYQLDNPKGKVREMVTGNILSEIQDDEDIGIRYYQVRYLKDWIVM